MQREKITIKEINEENWYECCELKISETQQKYLEPNSISILHAKFEHSLKPYAIYLEEKVVGFLMFTSILEELDGYWIYRLMVDEQYQGMGIAKKATQLMMSEIENLRNAKKIVVGYHPENIAAYNLYNSLGFVDYGNRFGKEMAVVKILNAIN